MRVCYDRLWNRLEKIGMNRGELMMAAGLGFQEFKGLYDNEVVSIEVLLNLCRALVCDIGQVMEVIHDGDCVK